MCILLRQWLGGMASGVLPKALEITYRNLFNFPVTDPLSVSEWNTVFDLPTRGTPFTSVEVDGTTVKLYGGANIEFRGNTYWQEHGNVFKVIDNAGCITSLTNATFNFGSGFEHASSYTHFIFPAVTEVSPGTFAGNLKIEVVFLPKCTVLGGTITNNDVFDRIIDANVSITIPSELMTCDDGGPDGDILYLQANNTVNIILV